jgi:hypothetical protein
VRQGTTVSHGVALVAVVALASAVSLCPRRCLDAPAPPARTCHHQGPGPAGSSHVETCCRIVASAKSMTPTLARLDVVSAALPAPAGAPPTALAVHRVRPHPGPPRPLYLHTHALLI